MQNITTTPLALAIIVAFAPVNAWSDESSYSKLNFDKHCKFENPASEEEAGMGARAVCQIDDAPVIFFEDGDLRHSAGFGAQKDFQSFGQFNRMNTTIEWRSDNQGPYAAIVRWFIENMNPDSGMADKKYEGQVLVVSRVATQPQESTCIVGMVDAKANKNANVLARKIADTVASPFNCASDRAKYYGNRGDLSGDPGF